MKAGVFTIAAVSALATAAVWIPAVFAADQTKASLWVDNTHLNMGRVVAGSTATATYVFHNDSDADIHIVRATPT
jgi:hypothetical protein